ncbi:hypothetical protein BJ742DRAFT_286313 [Cladochytrium replicatum]|nr:hypothetical protein BJ742DRAFT_286313 [Cladochytrium replicatum]
MDPEHKDTEEVAAPVEHEKETFVECDHQENQESVLQTEQSTGTDVDTSASVLKPEANSESHASSAVRGVDSPGVADVVNANITEQQRGEDTFESSAAGPCVHEPTVDIAHGAETTKAATIQVIGSNWEDGSAIESQPNIDWKHYESAVDSPPAVGEGHLLSINSEVVSKAAADQAHVSVNEGQLDYPNSAAVVVASVTGSFAGPERISNSAPVPPRPDALEPPLVVQRPASRTSNRSSLQHEYRLKAVELPLFSGSASSNRGYLGQSNTRKIKIITQNENGPCPLLSLCNVMILRGDMELSYDAGWVTYEHLVTLLGEYLFSHSPTFDPQLAARRKMTEEQLASFAQNLNDVMDLMPSLQTGLDVNVRFDSPYSFETTPSLLVFDIFSIPLCHGWTVDHQDSETYRIVVRDLASYNRVVESIIARDVAEVELAADAKKRAASGGGPSSTEEIEIRRKWERAVHEGMVAKDFLNTTASQLTIHGLSLLTETLPAHSYSVIFRNNHFSVVWKRGHNEPLLTLVTDQGFLEAPGVVWETLDNVEGDSMFLDGFGRVYAPDRDDRPAADVVGQNAASAGIVGDYPELLAQPDADRTADDDFALALSLQDEENARHEEYLQRQREQPYPSRQTRGQGEPTPPWHQQTAGDHRQQRQQQQQQQDWERQQQQRNQQSQRMERKKSEDNCSLM